VFKNVLICSPVSHPDYVVPGSTMDMCSNPTCRKPVWVAPSGQQILRDQPEVVILCNDCAFAQIAEKGGEIQGQNPEQQREIKEYRRRN